MIWMNAYFYDTIKKEYVSNIPLPVNFGTNTDGDDNPIVVDEYGNSLIKRNYLNPNFNDDYPIYYWGEYEFRNITYSLYQQNYVDYIGNYNINLETTGVMYFGDSGILPIEIHSKYIDNYNHETYYPDFLKYYIYWNMGKEVGAGGFMTYVMYGTFEIHPKRDNPDDTRILAQTINILNYHGIDRTRPNQEVSCINILSDGDFFEQNGMLRPRTFFANNIPDIYHLTNSTVIGTAVDTIYGVDSLNNDSIKEFARVPERTWTSSLKDDENGNFIRELIKIIENQGDINAPIFPGDTQQPERPNGLYEDLHDNIEYPNIPSITSSTSGFITLYSPTIQQIKNFAGYMWNGMSNAGDLFNALNKMVANPIEMVLGLSILPFPIETIGEREIKVGLIGTGIMMNLASSQYKVVDCGSLQMYPYFGSALDYSPYTKVSIYLPYIGVRSLNIDEVQGKTLEVRYHIDILTGALSAMIKVNGSVMYTFGGMCAQMIPITSTNWATMLGTIATLVAVPLTAGMAGSIAGAMGAKAAASAGASAATASATTQAAKSAATIASVSSSTADILGQAGALATSIAKPSVQRSGSVTSSSAFMDVQYPYIILERPRQSLPKDYNKFVGYPANYTAELATLSGFTRVDSVKLVINGATNNELLEIKNLLETGVII